MPSPSLLQLGGSKAAKETRYAPIFTDRFFVGLWTNRNPLRSPLGVFYSDGWHLGGTDALLAGENIELSPRLTLCRRPGNNQYSTATIPQPPNTFYPFWQFGSPASVDVMVDTPSQIYTLTPTALTSIFTKAATAGQANFLGIGGTLYFGDGAEVKAWSGAGATRNWGIANGAGTGPNTAGTGADGGGPNAWSNPSHVTNSSGFATVTTGLASGIHPSAVTNNLDATNFSFSVPASSSVTGIGMTLTGFYAPGGLGSISGVTVWAQLIISGSPVGSPVAFIPDISSGTMSFGGANILWGATPSPSDINASGFGIAIFGQVQHGFGPAVTATFSIQNVQVTIYASNAPSVSQVGSGSFSATTGYQYVYAYGNSSSGQVSSASSPSTNTGAFTSIDHLAITLVASTDTQVNQIWLFRTADGGSTFLNLPGSPFANANTTVSDSAPDSELNILQQAPINLQNNPPVYNAVDPVYYLGIVWVHAGNAVYFSRTPSAVVGLSQESFPPANVFTFPETVIRKIPINSGLLVITTSNIYIIVGQNTSTSPLYSAPFLNGYGIQSWNSVWVDGSIIYFFTSDNRMIRLDPSSGVEDMGFPIGDQLATFVPSRVYVTYHSATSNDAALYLGDGSTGWFRCNPNQAPDGQITGPVWSPQAIITGGCQAIASVETSPGQHQLMIGGTGPNEPVLVRDSRYLTFTDNGTPYEANYTIGNIVLAQPGQQAKCRFITYDAVRIGNPPQISVNMDEILEANMHTISGYMFRDPTNLPASTTIFNNRCYFKQTVGTAPPPPVRCRFMSIEVDYGTDQVQNEILSLTVNGAILNEK